jgi:hypothetical protein
MTPPGYELRPWLVVHALTDCGALARDLCDCAPCAPVRRTGPRDYEHRPKPANCHAQRRRAQVSKVEETGVRGSHPRAARALDWWARTRGTCRKLAAVTCSELP